MVHGDVYKDAVAAANQTQNICIYRAKSFSLMNTRNTTAYTHDIFVAAKSTLMVFKIYEPLKYHIEDLCRTFFSHRIYTPLYYHNNGNFGKHLINIVCIFTFNIYVNKQNVNGKDLVFFL